MTSQAKVYVAVIASFSEDGNLFPRRLRWEDGCEYSIEKVLDVRPAAALKAGSQGDHYTVQINGHQSYLIFERSPNISGTNLKNGLWNENNRFARETNNADRSLSDRLFIIKILLTILLLRFRKLNIVMSKRVGYN